MKKLTLLFAITVLIFGMVACSEKSADLAPVNAAKTPATIDMVATHDIPLDISIAQLIFVPNSLAPWLGRIILLDDAGHLYSTDIEGRDPKRVGNGKFIDMVGLAREAEPGVFLAITGNNKIEAFIESDDIGNFSPMFYSGEPIDAQGFCLAQDTATKTAMLLTANNEIKRISFNIEDKHFEQTIIEPIPVKPKIKAENSTYENVSECAKNHQGVGYITSIPTEDNLADFTSNTFHFQPSKTGGLLINGDEFQANIKNGLSVRGVTSIKYIASTQSNYGGGAYAKGVLALVDADENRIVFISMSYAERQLLQAFNHAKAVDQ